MSKTKLGISVGLLAAAIYASGLLSSLITVLLVGYVLLLEDDVWLRRSAVKAMAILMIFGVLTSGITVVSDVFDVLAAVVHIVFSSIRVEVPLNLDTILSNVLAIFRNLLLINCAFQSLHGGTVKVKMADQLIDKHM